MMNKSRTALCGVIALALPAMSHAIELVGKQLELYGKVHLSVDYSDPDVDGEDRQTSISNNSSRIGFKGEHGYNEQTMLLWQFEQEVDVAEGGGEFAKRNSFVGVRGNLGELRIGHHDTPSKILGSRWGMFSDTVGDRRAIFGAYSGYGNVLNDRADNAVLYIKNFNLLELQAMYSTSNPAEDTSGGLDDNDFDLGSASLTYQAEKLTLGAAIEQWSLDPVNSAEKVNNLRVAARYNIDRFTLGAIYEATDSDDNVYDRDAYGLNAAYNITKATNVRVQTMIADDYKDQDSSGATQFALGIFNNLDKVTQIYAVYTTTNNDNNAAYQGIDGGHGDEVETTLGGNPSSFSVGGAYKF